MRCGAAFLVDFNRASRASGICGPRIIGTLSLFDRSDVDFSGGDLGDVSRRYQPRRRDLGDGGQLHPVGNRGAAGGEQLCRLRGEQSILPAHGAAARAGAVDDVLLSRIQRASTPGAALLAEPPQFPTTFTTLPAPGSSSTFSFDVLGDLGETSLTNAAPLGTYNPYQAALDAQLAASAASPTNPALFALSTGDIAYNDGSTTDYGDLNHPADGAGGTARQSGVFDGRYWGKVGSSLPLYSTLGNHGRSSTFVSTWPMPTNVSSSAGVYSSSTSYSPQGPGKVVR